MYTIYITRVAFIYERIGCPLKITLKIREMLKRLQKRTENRNIVHPI